MNTPRGNDLPPGVTVAIALIITVLFIINVVSDIVVKGYNGYPTTLVLAGLLGGVLGLDRFLRKGNGGE